MKFTLLATALSTLSAGLALASDHREAPLVQEDLTADLADVYLFTNPSDASRLVLAMTVNGFTAPTENTTFNFSRDVRYSFKIDNNGDARPDADIEFTFDGTSAQQFNASFSGLGDVTGQVTPPTLEPAANAALVTMGPANSMIFAGQRDDPFFFDVVGTNRVLAGTGPFTNTDGFAGYNVSAIVVEFDASFALGSGNGPIQVWAETERRRTSIRLNEAGEIVATKGPFSQVDRVGNPAVNTVLITPNLKDLYNVLEPRNDGRFAPTIVASLQALGTDQTNIGILASVAIPDTLKYDPNTAVGYPNGRGLADDVVDTLFFFIFNQQPVSDGVDTNDRAFSGVFPYLAEPFQPL